LIGALEKANSSFHRILIQQTSLLNYINLNKKLFIIIRVKNLALIIGNLSTNC
jgi:hypothetical protein